MPPTGRTRPALPSGSNMITLSEEEPVQRPSPRSFSRFLSELRRPNILQAACCQPLFQVVEKTMYLQRICEDCRNSDRPCGEFNRLYQHCRAGIEPSKVVKFRALIQTERGGHSKARGSAYAPSTAGSVQLVRGRARAAARASCLEAFQGWELRRTARRKLLVSPCSR